MGEPKTLLGMVDKEDKNRKYVYLLATYYYFDYNDDNLNLIGIYETMEEAIEEAKKYKKDGEAVLVYESMLGKKYYEMRNMTVVYVRGLMP
jgi:hypothetical protein